MKGGQPDVRVMYVLIPSPVCVMGVQLCGITLHPQTARVVRNTFKTLNIRYCRTWFSSKDAPPLEKWGGGALCGTYRLSSHLLNVQHLVALCVQSIHGISFVIANARIVASSGYHLCQTQPGQNRVYRPVPATLERVVYVCLDMKGV